MSKIKVLVNGAGGKMGREVVRAVSGDDALELAAAVDAPGVAGDAGELAGLKKSGIQIENDLKTALAAKKPDVVVDFTVPNNVMSAIRTCAAASTNIVVGTTGLSDADLKEIASLCEKNKFNVFVAPNFAIGAVLMMRFSKEAAKYMPKAEIVELHHDQKLDAPSGTAIKTAAMMKEASGRDVPMHSVRLPGFVASQEVILGAQGQTLKIRHDSINRECFMPGVLLAVKKIGGLKGFVHGLEHIM